jgi:hypothetical protein
MGLVSCRVMGIKGSPPTDELIYQVSEPGNLRKERINREARQLQLIWAGLRRRIFLMIPVRESRTPGSVRGC